MKMLIKDYFPVSTIMQNITSSEITLTKGKSEINSHIMNMKKKLKSGFDFFSNRDNMTVDEIE